MIKNNKKTSKSLKKFKKIILFFLLFCLFLPKLVFAVDVFFESKTQQPGILQEFEVEFFVKSEEEYVNAFEGKIFFQSNIVELKRIKDGNSIVNFWIERPSINNNYISFSGIIPGGFKGERGLLFSFIFQSKVSGILNFQIRDMKILKNDGLGSESAFNIIPFEMQISEKITEPTKIDRKEDKTSPELFMPEITRNDLMYDGKWFAVFATQDKGSGISHYEVRESQQKILSMFKRWVLAKSPHILEDQELRSFVWIKAVDKAGNQRIVTIKPKNSLLWYENYINWIIIIIAFLIIRIVSKFVWRKNLKKQK